MPSMKFNNQNITYTLRLDKRRKSIQLRILPTSVVEIVAPAKLTATEIRQILTTKKTWLTRRLSKLTTLADNPVNQELAPGHLVLYQGEPHSLIFLPGNNKPEVLLKPQELVIKLPADCPENEQTAIAAHILKNWLINQAGAQFQDKTRYWADIIGVRPVRVTIKDQKTRWGSCSSLGNINYNWRIIMAPSQVADYLVIHELCHLLEPNHSDRFWSHVSRFSPNYKVCRRWLADNGKLLSRIL